MQDWDTPASSGGAVSCLCWGSSLPLPLH